MDVSQSQAMAPSSGMPRLARGFLKCGVIRPKEALSSTACILVCDVWDQVFVQDCCMMIRRSPQERLTTQEGVHRAVLNCTYTPVQDEKRCCQVSTYNI